MCCTFGPAKLGKTKIFMGEAQHPAHGLVHVIGYQNTPQNQTDTPNAMILHLPSAEPMGKQNVIEMGSGHDGFLEDLCQLMAARNFGPQRRGGGRSFSDHVQIFETGIYTVVQSSNASLIPAALSEVPESKRPPLNPAIFDWYDRQLQTYTFLVCCFNNAVAGKTAPPLWFWYKPIREDVLMAPGLDAHDGRPPEIDQPVEVDTSIVIGSFRSHEKIGKAMPSDMPEAFKLFAPTRLRGHDYAGNFRNGDYLVDAASLGREASTSDIIRRGVIQF